MSYHKRDFVNSNSAIVTSVNEEDYGDCELSALNYQKEIERKAFLLGGGNYFAPCQRLEDYINGVKSSSIGKIKPSILPGYTLTDLNLVFSSQINKRIKDGILSMGKKLKGFDYKDAILTGVESRTSSPVRLDRNEEMKSIGIENLYVIGDGSGYSGGIVSAAIDGIRAFENITKN